MIVKVRVERQPIPDFPSLRCATREGGWSARGSLQPRLTRDSDGHGNGDPGSASGQRNPRIGWVQRMGRIGIGTRGVTDLVLAYLAFDIARHGNAPTQATSTGALEEVGHRSGGSVFLTLLAVGLGSYAIWRLRLAVISREGTLRRLGSLVIAVIYVGLFARALELAAGRSTNGGAATNPGPLVVKVMGWPAGRQIVQLGGRFSSSAGWDWRCGASSIAIRPPWTWGK